MRIGSNAHIRLVSESPIRKNGSNRRGVKRIETKVPRANSYLSAEELEAARTKYPLLTRDEIYELHSLFESLVSLNSVYAVRSSQYSNSALGIS